MDRGRQRVAGTPVALAPMDGAGRPTRLPGSVRHARGLTCERWGHLAESGADPGGGAEAEGPASA